LVVVVDAKGFYCEMVENATMAPNRQSISVQFDRAGTANDDLLKHVD
jgi:hypothetical protein